MGFWIFMSFMAILLPIVMLAIGISYAKGNKTSINYIMGYRTNMSMKNRDTWQFAHKYFAKICMLYGKIILVPSILAILLTIGKSDDTIGIVISTVVSIQTIAMLLTIIPTEIALHKIFDKNGNRKDEMQKYDIESENKND